MKQCFLPITLLQGILVLLGCKELQVRLQPHAAIFHYLKVRLWVLLRDQTLTHLSIDISLIPEYILNHNISLES